MELRTPSPTASRATSLVVTPAVVAHRGASGVRPEHTLAAYTEAIRAGVDDIELDLVATRDGVLVARHENELSATTDVAEHPGLADRRTTKRVDGRVVTGWFTEDLTLAELRRLRARERMPLLRPASAAYDGQEGVPTFDEVLALVRSESVRQGRSVGVMVELKHATHFAGLGLPLDVPLLADLARHGLDHPRSRVSVLSFETGVLRDLAPRCRLPLVQLVDLPHRRPWDLAVTGDPRTYGDLLTAEGLAWIDGYADGLGVHRDLVLPPDAGDAGPPSTVVADAHRLWLTVHVWTLRAENRFLPPARRIGTAPGAHGDLAGEVAALLEAGVDGVITDHPSVALGARTWAGGREAQRS